MLLAQHKSHITCKEKPHNAGKSYTKWLFLFFVVSERCVLTGRLVRWSLRWITKSFLNHLHLSSSTCVSANVVCILASTDKRRRRHWKVINWARGLNCWICAVVLSGSFLRFRDVFFTLGIFFYNSPKKRCRPWTYFFFLKKRGHQFVTPLSNRRQYGLSSVFLSLR